MIFKPHTELCENYDSISELAHTTGEPICITVDGKKDLTVMSVEAYEKWLASLKA